MKSALKSITRMGLGVLVVINKKNQTVGILTDGDIKRLSSLNTNFQSLKIKIQMN